MRRRNVRRRVVVNGVSYWLYRGGTVTTFEGEVLGKREEGLSAKHAILNLLVERANRETGTR